LLQQATNRGFIMGLLDGYLPSEWRGLLNATVDSAPPRPVAPWLLPTPDMASGAAQAPGDAGFMQFGADGSGARNPNPVALPGSAARAPFGFAPPDPERGGLPPLPPVIPPGARRDSLERNDTGSPVQLAQYAPPRLGLPLPPLPPAFNPGTPANKEWTRRFIDDSFRVGRAIGDAARGIFHNEKDAPQLPQPPSITPRPDLPPLAGGRTGNKVPSLTGPPNSAILGGPGRIFVTDANGNVVVDIDGGRAKDITPGGRAGAKRRLTAAEIDLLDKMGR
jgi:hypothetical protein